MTSDDADEHATLHVIHKKWSEPQINEHSESRCASVSMGDCFYFHKRVNEKKEINLTLKIIRSYKVGQNNFCSNLKLKLKGLEIKSIRSTKCFMYQNIKN